MFLRRDKQRLFSRARNLIWPEMGFWRATVYIWKRLHRIRGTPESIAAGFAIGIAVSCTPMVGGHVIISAALSWVVRGSILASFIGTLVVNPWTAPPIWFSTYYAGRVMKGEPVLGKENAPHFVDMFTGLTEAILQLDARLFIAEVWPILKYMALGSIPVGIASGFAIYFILRPIIARLQDRRREARALAAAADETAAVSD